MKRTVFLPLLTLALAVAILLGASFGLQRIGNRNAAEEHLWMMRTLLPGSENFTVEPYSGDDSNIVSVHKGENGFVIETTTFGYAGPITMLVGVTTEGKVVGIVVKDMSETFGLGANALHDHEFLSQFLNSEGSFAIGSSDADAFSGATEESSSTDAQVYVDGMTGATVTSKAIIRCVNSAVAYVTGADASSGATSWGG